MYTPLAEYLATPIYGHWSRYGGDNSPSTYEAMGYVEATCKAHVSFNIDQAIGDLLKKQARGEKLPQIGMCGAGNTAKQAKSEIWLGDLDSNQD